MSYKNRRCQTCTRGVIQPFGYTPLGRKQYKCSNCGETHTCGRNGYPWDKRPNTPE